MNPLDKITVDPPLETFRRDLKAIGPAWPKRLRKVNAAAAKRVSESMKKRYDSRYPRRTGQGRGSIRASAGQTQASVSFGSARVPYMGGQNFGSGGRFPQFPKRVEPDHFAFSTIRHETPAIRDLHEKELGDLMSEAFPD